jgi:hypothetical protein
MVTEEIQPVKVLSVIEHALSECGGAAIDAGRVTWVRRISLELYDAKLKLIGRQRLTMAGCLSVGDWFCSAACRGIAPARPLGALDEHHTLADFSRYHSGCGRADRLCFSS